MTLLQTQTHFSNLGSKEKGNSFYYLLINNGFLFIIYMYIYIYTYKILLLTKQL